MNASVCDTIQNVVGTPDADDDGDVVIAGTGRDAGPVATGPYLALGIRKRYDVSRPGRNQS